LGPHLPDGRLEAALVPAMRTLCRIDDIPESGCKGFPPPSGGFTGLLAIRKRGEVFVYVNSCPHLGVSLDWTPDRFLSADGSLIVCSTHGAEFRIEDGRCIRGPCSGDHLEAVSVQIRDGLILVPEAAGL
jgi:nitrite reductase/ring-hydroxylating ferredoxin subunit